MKTKTRRREEEVIDDKDGEEHEGGVDERGDGGVDK